MRVPISTVIVNEGRRPLRDVKALADSIREVGLINPITITAERVLVAGLHRLEATKMLGWKEIEATVLGVDDLLASLAEIDENLVHNELTMLERFEALKRRKEIYEALHPETKRGGDRKSDKIKATNCRFDSPPSFAKDTASKMGVSERTVQRGVEIASKLDDDVKEVIANTPIADRQTDLSRLAKHEPEEQKRLARHIKDGAKTVAEAEAQATGERNIRRRQVSARTTSKTPEKREANAIRALYDAIRLISIAEYSPEEMIRLGEKHKCRGLDRIAKKAAAWLIGIAESAAKAA